MKIEWHELRKETPCEIGYYLTASDINPDAEEGERRFAFIDVNTYYPRGAKIVIFSQDHYNDIPCPMDRLVKVITDPDTVESIGAFYTYGEDDEPYPLSGITHWAYLPDVPKGYDGDQNDDSDDDE